MKTIASFIILLGSAFAQSDEINWDNITVYNVAMDPIPTAPRVPAGRIVGGIEVIPNSIPFQVALIINGASFCGGSLISRDWVLTAAHCTSGASYVRATLGGHNIQQSEATQVVVTSSSIINHPLYNRATLSNDIALIRLPFSVPLSRAIQIVNLAPATAGTYEGFPAQVSGWGKTSDTAPAVTSTLRAVSVSVISNNVCAQTYGALIQAYTVCTSGGGLRGGCHGDSGGPLTAGGAQIGIVSFVSSWGCQSGTPTAYTRVSSFRNWITANSGV